MSNLIKNIKRFTKTHTLFDEIGGLIINKTSYANKYMSTVNAMYKTYTKIQKKVGSLIILPYIFLFFA